MLFTKQNILNKGYDMMNTSKISVYSSFNLNKPLLVINDCPNIIFWLQSFLHIPPKEVFHKIPCTEQLLKQFQIDKPFKLGKNKNVISSSKKFINLIKSHPSDFTLIINE